MFVFFYVYSFVIPLRILAIIRTACNCDQPMRPQATGSNPLNVSIIFPPVHPSGLPRDFCNFVFLLFSSVGVQFCDEFIKLKIVLKGMIVAEERRLKADLFFAISWTIFCFVDPILMMPIQWNGRKEQRKQKVISSKYFIDHL